MSPNQNSNGVEETLNTSCMQSGLDLARIDTAIARTMANVKTPRNRLIYVQIPLYMDGQTVEQWC